MGSLVIDPTKFVYRPTNMCKAIYPHFLEGGGGIKRSYIINLQVIFTITRRNYGSNYIFNSYPAGTESN